MLLDGCHRLTFPATIIDLRLRLYAYYDNVTFCLFRDWVDR